MGSQAINHAADGQQETATINVADGEFVRVRFSSFKGPSRAELKIVANGVTSYIPIGDQSAWTTDRVATGDVISVRTSISGAGEVIGILETINPSA